MCFPLKKTKQKLEEEKNACHTTYIVPKNQQDKIKLNELDKEQNSGFWEILLLMSALIFCTTDQSVMSILEKPFKRLDVLKRPQKIDKRERSFQSLCGELLPTYNFVLSLCFSLNFRLQLIFCLTSIKKKKTWISWSILFHDSMHLLKFQIKYT